VTIDRIEKRVLVTNEPLTSAIIDLGETLPDLILLDHNSWGYARIRFTPENLAFILANLKYLTNVGARTHIWRHLVDMVASNELPIKDWFTLIMNNLEFETEEQTLALVLWQVVNTFVYGLFTEE